jgi:hypothetical protein
VNRNDSARFDRYRPHPELATLHAGDFRTKVHCVEQGYIDALVLSWCSLLSGRGADSRGEREPQEPCDHYRSAQENPNTNRFFCSHKRFLLAISVNGLFYREPSTKFLYLTYITLIDSCQF